MRSAYRRVFLRFDGPINQPKYPEPQRMQGLLADLVAPGSTYPHLYDLAPASDWAYYAGPAPFNTTTTERVRTGRPNQLNRQPPVHEFPRPAADILLTVGDWWNEIEATDLAVIVKDQLKGMVGAWLNVTIPPTATPTILRELNASGVKIVAISGDGRTDYFEISEFVPGSKDVRSFTALRKTYPGGHWRPL